MTTAVVSLCKCMNSNRIFGIRLEKDGVNWKYTWAFPIQEKTALKEDYDKTNIVGTLVEGEEFPGCPYCGTKQFFYCDCGKMNCWDGESQEATCGWCGNSGILSEGIDHITITGNL